MTDWRPIETAPKDGTTVQVALWAWNQVGGQRLYCYARYGQGGPHWQEVRWDEVGEKIYDPTHWMPLPPPPQ